MTDTQLFGGQGLEQENARMVLRTLKSGTLKNQPHDHETNWGDLMELWGSELARFDYDVLERAARTWITQSGSEVWPTLTAFITWSGVVERELKAEANHSINEVVCDTCGGKNYITIREGMTYTDPRDDQVKVAIDHFAIPCWSCPHMENRYQLWRAGHFDLEHDPCGRCREYRIPGTRTKVNR